MLNGMDFLAFLASSPNFYRIIKLSILVLKYFQFLFIPVEAIESKPTKAKKHLAAPAITPAIPYGKNPPVPNPGGTSSSGMLQFAVLAYKKHTHKPPLS